MPGPAGVLDRLVAIVVGVGVAVGVNNDKQYNILKRSQFCATILTPTAGALLNSGGKNITQSCSRGIGYPRGNVWDAIMNHIMFDKDRIGVGGGM